MLKSPAPPRPCPIPLPKLTPPVIMADSLESLQHDDRVPTNDLTNLISSFSRIKTPWGILPYHHANPNFLPTSLLLYGVVQHNVQEHLSQSTVSVPGPSIQSPCKEASRLEERNRTYIVASKDADDFATAVQLDEEPFVEVLRSGGQRRSYRSVVRRGT